MNQTSADDIGKLIIRLALGLTMLLHGMHKLVEGLGGIEDMLEGAGLPRFIAWGALPGEVLGPLLLIVGFYSRIGSALIAINMLFAIGLAHMDEIFALTEHGGWAIELQAMLLFTAIGLMLAGPGRIGINTR